MTAFRAILEWEIRAGLRRISTWVYFSIFFFLAFMTLLAMGGAWQDLFVGVGGGGRMLANSPYALASIIPVFTLLGLSVTAAIAGNALHRDYDAGIDPLVYTTPVSRAQFLGGRFVGALALNLVVFSSVGVGAALATVTPWVKADRIAPFDLLSYLAPYATAVLPNLLLTAAIFFALVSLTRQMLPVYVGGVLLLIGYLTSSALLGDLENKQLAALIDPFGLGAQGLVTQYWSVAEKNTLYVPFEGVILWNRLIWTGVGLAIFGLAYWRFRFAHVVGERKGVAATAPAQAQAQEAVTITPEVFLARVQPGELPRVTRLFDGRTRWIQFWAVVTGSFWRIVWNRYFAVIVGAGLLFLGIAAREAGRIFGTPTWPVTYHVEELLTGSFGIFLIVIVAFYSGELVWADRDNKSNQITDATPVPTPVVFLGKFVALAGMVALLQGILMVAGIITQAAKGYYRFEIPLYVQSLFAIRYVDMLLLLVMAMTIHVLSNHKYVAHLIIILSMVGMGFLPLLGLERNLYQYGSDSGAVYSDMNGWGPFLAPFFWWKAYWAAFAVLLLLAINLLWMRGEDTGLAVRARLARGRITRKTRLAAGAAGLSFAGLGGFLFYNTDHLNDFRPRNDGRRLSAEREKRYKHFETAPQPRIEAVNVRADLQPRRQGVVATGHYVLRNKTAVPVDTVHLGLNERMEIRALSFDQGAEHVVDDPQRNHHMFRLARPLGPGDSVVLRFELAYRRRGIPNTVRNLAVVENGTFLSSGLFLPSIGYSSGGELSDDDQRRKEGLEPKPRMRPPTDPGTLANNYISHDADWIRFEATVSTDEDQVALIPGYLQREWVEGGRRHFHYTMDAPILNFWAVLSGRYAVLRDAWNDVEIAIYHHPSHTYNLDRMVAGVQKSLDYFTEHFGPYQHRQVRIIEFPRYQSFAQSLPNTIPYSEAVGFIARVEKPEDIDYPFYITAHEVAHQWWAHQVIGADAQGATMLSETLSQYAALMVMEKEYGPRNMQKFLAYELDQYLLQRGAERKREMPLQFVENQPYIHYNKGSLVMYALRDYIGEDRVNRVLRGFLEETKFRGPPYPTSLQLVDALRDATPDSLKYLITDLFETITLFELRTDSAVVTDAPDEPGRFQVDLWVHAKKVRADSLGTETDIPMSDWVDIGVYARPPRGERSQDKNGIPLYLAKQRVDSGPQQFTVVVDERPFRAGIDPLHKLIDRRTGDNTVTVRDRSTPPARQARGGRDTAADTGAAGRDTIPR